MAAAVFSNGLERILYGMVKIVFFWQLFIYLQVSRMGEKQQHYSAERLFKGYGFYRQCLCTIFRLSDLAIGMGLLWGIKVIENFNYPFMATNMQDFWTRWHISLSGWCRDYIFQPIMALSRNRWLALVTAMLVLALWHEISWRYIFWGIFQTLLILLTIMTRRNFPAFSRFINHDRLGRWLGRPFGWFMHLPVVVFF